MREITQLKAGQHQVSLPFMDEKIDLRSLFYSLWEERKYIAVISAVGLMIGIFFAVIKVPQYQANTLIQVQKSQSSNSLIGASKLSPAMGGMSSDDAQIALIKSRYITIPAVKALGLDVSIEANHFPLIGNWYARKHSDHLSKPLLGLKQYAWGGEELRVSDVRIPSKYEGKKYKLVAGENQEYELYTPENNLILHGKVGKSAEINAGNDTTSILVNKLTANTGTVFYLTKTSTEAAADKIAEQLEIVDLGKHYQLDKTGVLQISMIGSHPKLIVDLLNQVALNAVKKNADQKSAEAAKTLTFLENQIPSIRAALSDLEGALNRHRMKSGTIDISLKSKLILRQITDVQRELEKSNMQRIFYLQKYTPIHPMIISLQEKKAALEEELKSLEKELQYLPASDQVSVNLLREIKIKTQLYLMILNKIQELKVLKAGTVSDVRILNLATMPYESLPLNRLSTVLVYFLFAFIIAVFSIIAKRAFNRNIDDPNWIEHRFGIPTFAIVPYSSEQKVNIDGYHDKSQNQLKLLAQHQPRDLAIEALRSLRTSLQFALLNASNNIISIMGISPGIGKSFVSANFSYVLADAGKRVLLIDGDIRKGYLHDYFLANRSPGLSELIIGEADFSSAIQKTEHENLDIISTGKFPFNPSELLMSQRFKDIMQELSSRYDLILIDTAPVLAVTDGAIIGNIASVNFLLVAWGKHKAEEIDLAMKRLGSNGVNVHGVIVNSTQVKNPAQGRYNYNYAYGEN